MQRSWLVRIGFSAAIWSLIYLLPSLIAYGTISSKQLFDGLGIVHFISTVLLIGYWYLNLHVLVPRYIEPRKYWTYAWLVIICGALVLWFPNIFQPGPPSGHLHQFQPSSRPRRNLPIPFLFGLGYNVILFIIATLGAIGLRLRVKLLEVEKQRISTELAFLKSQINPHFLFNTLNSIYALAIQKSDDTPTAIVQLSELMRYILKDVHEDTVDLRKELQYIDNFVALQKRRLGDTVHIDFDLPKSIPGIKIAPLLLMPFVENAFKHGVNPDQDSSINIRIDVDEKAVQLFVSNAKVSSVNKEGTIGIGLENTAARLQHLYPGKHSLEVHDDTTNFSVHLRIYLT